jgi:hypothetical protein
VREGAAMAIDLSIIGLAYLGIVLFGVFCVGVVMAIRTTIRQQRYLAKYDFLRVAEDAEEGKLRLHCQNERNREVQDQTQRGDAS